MLIRAKIKVRNILKFQELMFIPKDIPPTIFF